MGRSTKAGRARRGTGLEGGGFQAARPPGFVALRPMVSGRRLRAAALGLAGGAGFFLLDVAGLFGPGPAVMGLAFAVAFAFVLWCYRGAVFSPARELLRVSANARAYRPGEQLQLAWALAPDARDVRALRFSLVHRHYGALDEEDVARKTLLGSFRRRGLAATHEVTALERIAQGRLALPLPRGALPSRRRRTFLRAWVLVIEAERADGSVVRQEHAIRVRRAERVAAPAAGGAGPSA